MKWHCGINFAEVLTFCLELLNCSQILELTVLKLRNLSHLKAGVHL